MGFSLEHMIENVEGNHVLYGCMLTNGDVRKVDVS